MANVMPPRSPAPPSAEAALGQLAALVIKDGVSLGGLKEDERTLALALAATRFLEDEVMTELEVNLRLKRLLAEEGAFIGVDHVELRRWLVDRGWLQRDGFGRQYQRVAFAKLLPHNHAANALVSGLSVRDWVAEQKAQWAQRRAARHQQWQRAQSACDAAGA